VVPGIVPVELILARTPQRGIGLTGIQAYPVGFGCTLHLRLREVIPGEQSTFGAFNMFGDSSTQPASSPTTTCALGQSGDGRKPASHSSSLTRAPGKAIGGVDPDRCPVDPAYSDRSTVAGGM
jgi:hypothetical protein